FAEAMHFMFVFNWDNFTGQSVLAAMGQAFFSLSLGMGAIMAYGAYMPKTIKHRKTGKLVPVSIASTVFVVALLDVLTSLLLVVAIFPIVFTNGLDAASGPGLLLENLPLAFYTLSFDPTVVAMFFLFVLFAGLTSSISNGEPAEAWLV